MAKTKSSRRWMADHVTDFYVKEAQRQGYRSRAAFKLLEIDARDRILRPGATVVDLGAAPGGWSQVAAERVGRAGRVFGLDVLPMEPIPGVEFLQGDFVDESVLDQLLRAVGDRPVDLVLSDMAPNISGLRSVDQPRAMHLTDLALDFARRVLAPGGDFLVKVFQGEGSDQYHRELRRSFRSVMTRKPRSSRPSSRETYVLARSFHL